ncbi:hypothetical protein LGT39_08850 [Demequina sp. TTPB684]|uniref:hypothetical protein n=1 Tax=unclassified Demequina TaxID=2620311 RepID=UPI001CF0FFE7|nr:MULTISPECIES: hypothetical protein [unclassified Demequina]MCB2412953.1 hypothetical protein [Demequina sp. TTPB684]UPU88420.1 hypothetical protein LGT36_000395 [Demequina sp. TMPB413]
MAKTHLTTWMEDPVADRPGNLWTHALMASSGVAISYSDAPRHATPEQLEAADASTTLARLQRLAAAGDRVVRQTIAGRPDCPLGLLASLAHDRLVDVRVAVAGNSRLTDAVARHLAGDRDPRVLKALARNASAPRDIIESLAHHRKSEVRRVASREMDARWGVSPEQEAAPTEPEAGLPWELRDRVPAVAQPLGDDVGRPMTGPRQSSDAVFRPTAFNPFVTRSP